MAEVRLVDLEVIKQFSLAVRSEFASADALLAALDADRVRVLAAIDEERPPAPVVPTPVRKATPAKKKAAPATRKKSTAAPAKKKAATAPAKKKTKAAAPAKKRAVPAKKTAAPRKKTKARKR